MSPLFRPKQELSLPNENESAEEFCDRLAQGFADKAHHNKRESLLAFSIVLGATLLSPLLIAFGPTDLWARVVPALMSVLAAGCTAWLQLRKPQQLWALYRDAQRRLEDVRIRHRFQLAPFSDEHRDSLLAERSANIALDVHERWMPMVPSPEALGGLSSGQPSVAVVEGRNL